MQSVHVCMSLIAIACRYTCACRCVCTHYKQWSQCGREGRGRDEHIRYSSECMPTPQPPSDGSTLCGVCDVGVSVCVQKCSTSTGHPLTQTKLIDWALSVVEANS